MTTTTPLDAALENGAAATTPPGDNLLTDFLAADAAAFRALAECAGGRSAVDDDLGLSMGDAGSPSFFGNVAHATRPLDDVAAREAVHRVRSFYATGTGGPFLLFTAWPLGDLRGTGFDLAGHPPLMVRPAGAGRPALPTGDARIVHARTAAEIADFDRTLTEAYPAQALLPYGCHPPLFTEQVAGTSWRLVTAHLDGEPVATAAGWTTDHVVAIEAVSTRPPYRGRGLGALLTATVADATPGVPAALLASDDGRPVYERLGFVAVLRFTLWVGSR